MNQVQKQNQFLKNTNQGSAIVSLDQAKLPPQALELEQAVLGAFLIDKKGLNEAIDLLIPEVFYKPVHQAIYEAIFHLFSESEPIDILTVSETLKRMGTFDAIGGEMYLIQLTQKVSSAAHIDYHARIIIQKYIQRQLIELSSSVINKAYDETTDVFDLLDFSESKLFEITNQNLKKNSERADILVKQAIDKILEMKGREGLSGVPTGFNKIDKLTSGLQPSDLIILAARPGMGKTAFVLSLAKNVAIGANTPVAVFSLEMSSVQLITRLISGETGLNSNKLRKGNLEHHEWEQLTTKVKNLEEAPIFIDDTPALSIFDLRAKCRRLASQHGIKLIVIDYLQLMTAGGKTNGNREQEISMISRSLKALAKELEVPVIALSQLSRAVETRGGSKRPLLSDLRESGAIEQDADIVCFIYRPEYYGLTEWDEESDGSGSSCIGQGEFIVAKHRNGGLENIRLRFIGEQARFDNLDEDFSSTTKPLESKMNESKTEYTKNFNELSGGINITHKDAFGENRKSSQGNGFSSLEGEDDMPF